jgi:hypothetical protein
MDFLHLDGRLFFEKPPDRRKDAADCGGERSDYTAEDEYRQPEGDENHRYLNDELHIR